MGSPITSSNFDNQAPGASVCDTFREKLLNNNKLRQLLDYLFDAATGGLSLDFAREFLPFLPRVGEIRWFPKGFTDNIPSTGAVWLPCDGVSYVKDDYPALSSYIGSEFNALTPREDTVPADEFRVPDLRGRFLVGHGEGFSEKEQGGERDAQLKMPDHVHAIGRYQDATGDRVNDLILFDLDDAGFANSNDPKYKLGEGIKNKQGRRAQVKHDNDDEMVGAGDMIVSALPTQVDGADVGTIAQKLPPFQAGAYYILAGYKLRGTLL